MFWVYAFGWLLAYLLFGAIWARSQVVRLAELTELGYQARVVDKNHDHYFTWFNNLPTGDIKNRASWDKDTQCAVAAHLLFWPVSVVCRALVSLVGWVFAPVSKRRAELAPLELEIAGYTETLKNKSLPEDERRMLKDLRAAKEALLKERKL